jgi:hypothetical protein
MSTVIEDIQRQTEQINRLKQDMVKDLRVRFKDIFVPFFEKWPEVKFFRWAQYTPYFNDGDECVFGVNDLFGYKEGDDEDDEGSLSCYGDTKNPELESDFESLTKQFGGIEPSVLKDLFGDHAEIRVNRSGIEVTEYSHD